MEEGWESAGCDSCEREEDTLLDLLCVECCEPLRVKGGVWVGGGGEYECVGKGGGSMSVCGKGERCVCVHVGEEKGVVSAVGQLYNI